jgi:DNA modification methylase
VDDVTILHGDCLEILPTLEVGSVDAIITDPPFGVRSEIWDDMDTREFARFTMAWLAEARRIAPELLVFCNQDSITYDLCRMLYKRVRRLIWNKPPGSQMAGGRECGVWFTYECVLHCHGRESWSVVEPKSLEVAGMIRKAREAIGISRGAVDVALRGKKTGLCYRWEEAACLPTKDQANKLAALLKLNGEFHDALAIAYEVRNETKFKAADMASEHAAEGFDVMTHRTITKGHHPCEKPLGLMIELMETIGADYKVVLDPFAGSGTTGVACQKTGRRAILIEEDPECIPVIKRRIEAAETPLFQGLGVDIIGE